MSESHWGSHGGRVTVTLARRGGFPAGVMGVRAFRRATKQNPSTSKKKQTVTNLLADE